MLLRETFNSSFWLVQLKGPFGKWRRARKVDTCRNVSLPMVRSSILNEGFLDLSLYVGLPRNLYPNNENRLWQKSVIRF